jgi:hypothetical protein
VQWVIAGVMACQTALAFVALVLLPVVSVLLFGVRHAWASAIAVAIYTLICLAHLRGVPVRLKQVALAFEWLFAMMALVWLMTGFPPQALLSVVSHHSGLVAILVLLYLLVFLAVQTGKESSAADERFKLRQAAREAQAVADSERMLRDIDGWLGASHPPPPVPSSRGAERK